jgi:Bacterial SH3 domain
MPTVPRPAYDPAPMRRALFLLLALVALRCATPAPPPPEPVPEPVRAEPAPPPAPVEEPVIGTVRVSASALNVRAEASTNAEVLTQVKRGQSLDVLREDASWVKVRLAGGETGWVAARFVSAGAQSTAPKKKRQTGGCPPDSDYAFDEAPQLTFSEAGPHGLVVVEANVSAKGVVTTTRVISNATGDESLAFLAQREIKAAKFSPPIRDCQPRAFVFTYRRTF